MNTANNTIYGLVDGVTHQHIERVEDLNIRIASRQFPDYPLEPNYEPRPVPTKYSTFPIIDRRTPPKETKLSYPQFDTNKNFNPGTRGAPTKSYLNNIDTETILRNQAFSMQNCPHNVYVPTDKSDLYNVTIVSRPTEQPYPLLFQQMELEKSLHPNVESSNIGKNMLFNSTRVQLRNGM